MSDRYLVQDKGYRVIDMHTGELFADVESTTWVNVQQAAVVAMEHLYADHVKNLAQLGSAGLELKNPPKGGK